MSDQTSNDEIPKLPSPEELEEKWEAFKNEYGNGFDPLQNSNYITLDFSQAN